MPFPLGKYTICTSRDRVLVGPLALSSDAQADEDEALVADMERRRAEREAWDRAVEKSRPRKAVR